MSRCSSVGVVEIPIPNGLSNWIEGMQTHKTLLGTRTANVASFIDWYRGYRVFSFYMKEFHEGHGAATAHTTTTIACERNRSSSKQPCEFMKATCQESNWYFVAADSGGCFTSLPCYLPQGNIHRLEIPKKKPKFSACCASRFVGFNLNAQCRDSQNFDFPNSKALCKIASIATQVTRLRLCLLHIYELLKLKVSGWPQVGEF